MEALVYQDASVATEPVAPDAEVRTLLSSLESHGYTVSLYTCLEEAVATCQRDQPDLVIVTVPEAPALREPAVRALSTLRDAQGQSLLLAALPVETPPLVRFAVEAGADDYLVTYNKAQMEVRLTLIQRRLKHRGVWHRQATRRLWQQKELVDTILQASPCPIFVADADGTLLLANEAAARLNDRHVSELDHARIQDLHANRGESTEYVDHIRHVIQTGDTVRTELPFTAADTERWFYTVYAPIQWPNGSVHALGIGVDVTEGKLAKAALRESEAHFRALLRASVDAIVATDERGRIHLFNPAAEALFGYTADEVLAQNVACLVPPNRREKYGRYIRRYVQTGSGQVVGTIRRATARHKDGSALPVEVSVSEARLPNRRLFLGIIRDVSERQKLEQEVLEIGAAERQRIGQELHDGLGSLLTGAAMTARSLMRRLENDRPVAPDDLRLLADTIHSGSRQARLISRGLCPIDLRTRGLGDALRELADQTEQLSGLPCTLTVDDDVPKLSADKALHLYRIAQEAINNAVKHAEAEHIWIRLATDGDTLRLSVRDNGRGLPDASSATDGLGQRVMQYRADLIGATLTIKSAPSNGTLVTCRLWDLSARPKSKSRAVHVRSTPHAE